MISISNSLTLKSRHDHQIYQGYSQGVANSDVMWMVTFFLKLLCIVKGKIDLEQKTNNQTKQKHTNKQKKKKKERNKQTNKTKTNKERNKEKERKKKKERKIQYLTVYWHQD